MGGGWGERGAVGRLKQHSSTNGGAMPSVGDPDWHNSQYRPGLLLELIWHPLMPLRGHIGHEMHRGFTVSEKIADLAI